MTTPTSVRLTPSERAALDDYASRVDRDRSYVVRQAVNEFLTQRSSTTGASRLRDLEALANQHLKGAPMPDPDIDPMPPSVGAETSSGAAPSPQPNRSHMTDAERRQNNTEFLRSHPSAKLPGQE
jgi:hypothetical protein